MTEENELCPMAFSPEQAPVYGGGPIVVAFSDPTEFPSDGEAYLVFQGSTQRHVTRATQVNEQTLHSIIPAHDTAETIQLQIYLRHNSNNRLLAARHFEYCYDTAHHLAWFLVDSVNDPRALDDLELVKSECFDLANEILSTLDERLAKAFHHLTLPEDWNLLGDNVNQNAPEARDTLFHFCARLGLDKVASFLLDKKGSEEALKLNNRHGYTPKDIAMENNFQGLTELLSEYNSQHSMRMGEVNHRVEYDDGSFYETENGVTTLTTLHEQSTSTVDQDFEALAFIEERVRSNSERNINRLHQRQYETDWPTDKPRSLSEGAVDNIFSEVASTPQVIQEPPNHFSGDEDGIDLESPSSGPSTGTEPTIPEVVSATETVSQEFTNTEAPNQNQEDEDSSSLPDNSDYTERLHISDDEEDIRRATERANEDDNLFEEYVSDESIVPAQSSPLRSPVSPSAQRMVEIPEETVSMPASADLHTSSVLEASLKQLRGINTGLQKIRTNKFHQTVLQELRRENLQRFSSSCPSLDDQGRQSPLSPVREEDYHNSMLDLIQEAEPSTTSLPDIEHCELGSLETIDTAQYELESAREGVGTNEPDVRIFVNDVTVDSTEDGSLAVSEESHLPEFEPLKRREPTRKSVRRRSWCPDVRMRNVASDQRRDFKAEMLKTNGRSLSLSSLENGLASEDDDAFHDARENQTPSQSEVSLSNGQLSQPMDGELSPGDVSPGPGDGFNSPDYVEADGEQRPWEVLVRPERSLSSTSSVDTGTSSTPPNRHSADLSHVKMRAQTVGCQGTSLDNDQKSPINSLLVPHSSLMTKSRSTPSLPDATSLKPRQDAERKVDSPKRKAIKQWRTYDSTYSAQFRRQEEVEEDEDESLNQFLKHEDHKKSQISLTDFLNEQSYDSDGKSKSKDEKKRRPSVFSKLARGSHRSKKSKDKEGKQKGQTHQFVSVSFSNSTLCNVCGRSLANKPALRCESCMINVHENSCKEHIAPCLKYKQKVPQREGSVSMAQGMTATVTKEKQSIFSQASSGLRHVPSFKEKRSVSAPTRQQQQSVASGLNRSNTSPSSKVINEEGENDSSQRPDMEPSNLPDTLSVSMESLDEAGSSQVTDFEDDPELMLTKQEAETWTDTVDKKTLKKLHAKDIKRQDTIWELIQTELHYCRSLKILQMMFSRGMLNELHMTQETVDKLFPNLDDLIDMHMGFLRNLRQLQTYRADKSIDEIGPTLVQQFSGPVGDRMKVAYGRFCSLKEKSVQLYKELLKSDRKFQNFIKRCNMNILCQRREIPGFLLHISLRITKYPILIESILKTTKDKRDRESLSQALFLSKGLLEDVNAQIDVYQREQRLLEIYNRLDSKATATYKGDRFKKSDILSRKLLHEGIIGWRTARGKLFDVIVVVLSDLIIFLQENNQKYTFFSQDNKSSVISLYKLLVREKGDTRDSKGGIYLISQNKKEPEMYELVCKPNDKRETWINVVRTAAEQCPEEDEGIPSEIDEERRIQEARAAKLKYIIDQMQRKDEEIKVCCEEKNRLFAELLEMYSREEHTPATRLRQAEKVEQQEVGDVLQAAIQEASRLTVMLQSGNGSTNLSRSVSSVGEHVSASYMTPPVPKRAETFAGFDSHEKDITKVALMKKRFGGQPSEGGDRSVSPVHQPLLESAHGAGDPSYSKEVSPSIRRHGSTHTPPAPAQRPLGDRDEPDGRGSDPAIDRDTLGELGVGNPAFTPPSREHVVSIAQLAQYLHTIVHLTAQQGTAVESLRAQLAEANERINKLSAEMADRKTGYGHNQLEELRNLQATVSRDRAKMDGEKAKLFEERMKLEQERSELQSKKEELQKQKEILQKQVDMFNEAREASQSAVDKKPPPGPSTLGKVQSSSSFYAPSGVFGDQISHKRSASAEYPHTTGTESATSSPGYGKHISQPGGTGRDSQGRPMHRYSVASFSGTHGRTDTQGSQQKLPMHLLSCTNEQRVGSVAAVPQGGSVQQVLPFKLARGAGGSGTGSPGQGTVPATHSAPQLGLPTHLAQGAHKPGSTTSTSSLGHVARNKSLLKLAEPSGGRTRAASQPVPSEAGPQPGKPQQPASGEIYF